MNCGLPVDAPAVSVAAAQPAERSDARQNGRSDTGQTAQFQAVAGGGASCGDSPAPGGKQTFKQFLMKRHNIGGRAVPMFAIILAALIATATIATAAFLIYQNVAVGQTQEQTQTVPVKKKKTVRKQQKAEEESEEEGAADKKKSENKAESTADDLQQQGQAQDEQPAQREQQETEIEEPEDSSASGEATMTVEDTYNPASEAGSWTGALQQYGYKYGSAKSGSYKEGSAGCGVCYGAQNHPLKLNITSVDPSSRTASGTVSFLMHGHNGPLDADENSDSGDAYIENVPFTSISIDGWRLSNAIELYEGHGKTVRMTLRLKYGSSDDYSVWIRTVPTQFQAGKYNLTYTWGQTDMYTISKN